MALWVQPMSEHIGHCRGQFWPWRWAAHGVAVPGFSRGHCSHLSSEALLLQAHICIHATREFKRLHFWRVHWSLITQSQGVYKTAQTWKHQANILFAFYCRNVPAEADSGSAEHPPRLPHFGGHQLLPAPSMQERTPLSHQWARTDRARGTITQGQDVGKVPSCPSKPLGQWQWGELASCHVPPVQRCWETSWLEAGVNAAGGSWGLLPMMVSAHLHF